MRKVDIDLAATRQRCLVLGVDGENEATALCVDCSQVLADWPDARFALVMRRPDGHVYPQSPPLQANAAGVATFVLTDTDMAVYGRGGLEIRAYRDAQEDTGLYKSHFVPFLIRAGLQGVESPPAPPRPDWVDELLEALAGAGGGVPGPAGQDGKAATIAVGQTETVAHDMAASVVNVGTETDAVLDFKIPRGAPGDGGGGTGGIAEDSEKLGGQLPGYYAKADHVHAEYLTAEDDPAVPDWAKQPMKPTYTAAEIGAAAAAHTHAEYLTAEDDPTVPSWAKQPIKPLYDYAEITGTPVLAKVATSGAYADLTGAPTIPTIAADVGAAAADHSHAAYEAQMTATDSRLDSLIADLQAGKYTLQMAIKAGDFTDPTGVDIRRGAMDTSMRRIFA